MTIPALLQQAQQYQVVLVCGLYKSGTSLATQLLTQAGLFNPASTTNPDERAYGQQLARYSTNECLQLRSLNNELMANEAHDYHTAITSYLAQWAKPMVLKDPKLVYTLVYWLKVLDASGLSFLVVFTQRQQTELIQAWQKAPLTRGLDDVHGAVQTWSATLQKDIALCQEYGVPHTVIPIEALKAYSNSQPHK